jgi:hypothetical protein
MPPPFKSSAELSLLSFVHGRPQWSSVAEKEGSGLERPLPFFPAGNELLPQFKVHLSRTVIFHKDICIPFPEGTSTRLQSCA